MFNKLRSEIDKIALFDSRVFTIPSRNEVENYFIWRQQDTVRNSISSLAQSLYSHNHLYGKNSSEMQELCFLKGKNWNDLSDKIKNGRLISKETYVHKSEKYEDTNRTRWISTGAKTFTTNREVLQNLISDIL
jgi:tRNA(His) 5'-end guanylyltransferase